jgi:hypothetical protein
MAIIVALFIGLTVSAEEIFRDRKILEREKFLDLSRLSYLVSKINFLFTLSAIQSLSFILVSSLILESKGMIFQQWIILFSTACFGNMLGLNISAGMRTAVSIYILIPLILVPQLLLGGAMIKFDDLHRSVSNKIYVPMLGDIMVTRWAYEALCVEQFKVNPYEKPFFKYDMEISQNDWYASFLVPSLKVKVDECLEKVKDPANIVDVRSDFKKLNYHLNYLASISGIRPGNWIREINSKAFNAYVAGETKTFLDSLKISFRMKSRLINYQRDSLAKQIEAKLGKDQFINVKSSYYNENLANIVLNNLSVNKIYEASDKFIQKADPIYMAPGSRWGRSHFFAPYKIIGNLKIETLVFNTIQIWFMIIIMFVTLYYNSLKHFIVFLESLKLPILRKFGRELLQV